MKQYITEEEVSEKTGLAVQTLRNWRHMRRGLPYVKIGRSIRYGEMEVEAYMKEHTIRPEAQHNA